MTLILPAVAMGVDPFSTPAACLFLVEFTWTIMYETIYAYQDVQHDMTSRLKSSPWLCGTDLPLRPLPRCWACLWSGSWSPWGCWLTCLGFTTLWVVVGLRFRWW
ncbi:hypothetical protein BO94DRAFT_617134 [Aspergillus sclerotioniger CBS 115572]|uniref:Uncharacterized protein n=1 Tax=Aspergillus sclerotioniger CBS 115572 TaxID=1450535 RepID=A0A317WZK4_9EURO|nr:hypothetical protein BO94DRAFT_617134 [Aspergillus sclerotioniger CBS 115572]PWY91773.1 hypothetical protein BO94DRAFT_617134 [Aspergillus sclerotioniger CBS 115572]